MNEPLKFKLFSVYGQILHKNVLLSAFKRVKENDGCAGIDNVTIKEFDKHLDENIELILSELKSKTYKPSPVRRKYIPKKNIAYFKYYISKNIFLQPNIKKAKKIL